MKKYKLARHVAYYNVDGESIARQRLIKHVEMYETTEVSAFIARF
jgi:hypothetical protein